LIEVENPASPPISDHFLLKANSIKCFKARKREKKRAGEREPATLSSRLVKNTSLLSSNY
jgi:hypothetical protein